MKLWYLAICAPMCSLSAYVLKVPTDFSSIQAAIDAASDSDEIVVSAGTYTENIDFIGKNITVVSVSGRGVTTIDGNGNGATVLMVNDEDENAILDGFTIRGGSGWYNGEQLIGGGILVRDGSSPTLRNLLITNNTAITEYDGSGGGICISYGSTPTLDNIIIANNTAGWGGGLAIVYASPILNNVKIMGNIANAAGGGLYLGDYSFPSISGLTVYNNEAEYYAGGIFVNNNSYPNFFNLTVVENQSENGGGGIAICDNSHPNIIDGILWWNSPDQILLYDEGEYEPNTLNISYSDIEGGMEGIGLGEGSLTWGLGNISDDPLFVYNSCLAPITSCLLHTFHEDNYNLMGDSPCIGSGENGADMGAGEYSLTLETKPDPIISPGQMQLFQNYPNPFNPSTSFSFLLEQAGSVTLDVYDLRGQFIAILLHGPKERGTHSFNWLAKDLDGCNLGTGVYIYKLTFIDLRGSQSQMIKKFTLLK